MFEQLNDQLLVNSKFLTLHKIDLDLNFLDYENSWSKKSAPGCYFGPKFTPHVGKSARNN